MTGSRFIKTVTYGGYDKADVLKRLDHLNEQIFSLKNELRETKLLLEGSKHGEDIEKTIGSVLARERAKLTEVQVQNESLTVKLKSAEESAKKNEDEIKRLNELLEETRSKLAEANTQLAADKAANNAAELSTVFIEAKRSADMLETAAKEKADELEAAAAAAADRSIAYANDEGALIIHEAECKAAEIIADAKNAADEMDLAYNNMRSSIYVKMRALGEQLNDFKDALMKFEENGVGNLYECEEILGQTEETLKEGGVPEFREPVNYAPEYPERPKRKADLDSEEKHKRKNELDKLRQKAELLTGAKKKDEPVAEEKVSEAAPETAAAEEPVAEEKSNEAAPETAAAEEPVAEEKSNEAAPETAAPEPAAEEKVSEAAPETAAAPEPAAEEKAAKEAPAEKKADNAGDNKKDNGKKGKVDLDSLVKQAKALKNKK